MNPVKAREHFSEYREGTLSPGLRAGFERALAADPDLREDYRRFLAVVEALEARRGEASEVPSDLHDRIMARVDKSIFEATRRRPSSLLDRWRLAMFGGLGTAAVAATVLALLNAGSSGSQATEAGVAPPMPQTTMALDAGDGTILLRLSGLPAGRVEVTDPRTGIAVQSLDSGSTGLVRPIVNRAPNAVVRRIVAGDVELVVAIPGSLRDRRPTGEGTLHDLAVAIADAFGTAVQVRVKDANRKIRWILGKEDPLATEVDGKATVIRLKDGIYLLTE